MRSSFALTVRRLNRHLARPQSHGCRASGARWMSSPSSSTSTPTASNPVSTAASARADDEHTWSTPLAKQLAEAITTTGPVSVASYMRHCLTSDMGGYYTSSSATPSDRDPFGAKGDFVTSPEISQVFGELIGVWVVAEWMAQGRKGEGVYLMEVGPGRGTLMDDVLRTIRNFPLLARAIDAVYLIEASPHLRAAQHRLLCGDNPLVENDLGHESTSKHSPDLKVMWTDDIRFVPKHGHQTPFILAHEFFDALPIHVFQSVSPSPPATPASANPDAQPIQTPTGPIQLPPGQRRLPKENQWRELLVSPKPPHQLKPDEPEFELTLSPGSTPHSMYLPETSPRYRALKPTPGATIEISPESQAYARDFAVRLGGSNPPSPAASSPSTISSTSRPVSPLNQESRVEKAQPSGAALIIDYGPAASIPVNSLRGIRRHALTSPFALPGSTDLSADVDFRALADAALEASPGVEVHGPVDQSVFLTAMGIQERAAQLVKRAVDAERGGGGGGSRGGDGGRAKEELTEVVQRVETGWRRLVECGPGGMGALYRVMAVVPYMPVEEGEVRRRPVGFGGSVGV